MAFKLCSKEHVKERTKSTLGVDFDALFDNLLIPGVTLALARYCGRPDWDKTTRTEFFSPDSPRLKFLFVSSPPIAAAPAAQVWESTNLPRVYDATTALTLDQDFIVHEDLGIIERIGSWARGPRTVRVTYTGGYLTGDVLQTNLQGAPADLVEACVRQIKLIFDRREQMGLASESAPGVAFSFSSGLKLDPSVKELLEPFRVRSWPL